MKIQQEGILELLDINGSGQLCLDVDSSTPSLAIGMVKRGVETYIYNNDRRIESNARRQLELDGVESQIFFYQEGRDDLKFDFILLTQNKINIEALLVFRKLLNSNGTLLLNVNNERLKKVEKLISILGFSKFQIYLPFIGKEIPAFILPKDDFERYYHRYWSWKTVNISFLINKLIEYLFFFRLKKTWFIRNSIVLLRK